jgi:hypothetical protein
MPPKKTKKRRFTSEAQRDAWYRNATQAQRDAYEATKFSQEADDVGESTSRGGKETDGPTRYGDELTTSQRAALLVNPMFIRGQHDPVIKRILEREAAPQVVINLGQPSSSNVPPRKSMNEIINERLVAASIMDRLGRKASGPVSIKNRTGWKPATIISVMHNGTYRDVAMEDWQAPNKRWRDSYRENVRRDWNAKRRHILPTGYTPIQLAYRGFDTRVKPFKRVSPHKRSFHRPNPKPDYSKVWGLTVPETGPLEFASKGKHIRFNDEDEPLTPLFAGDLNDIHEAMSSQTRQRSLGGDFESE